MHEHITTISQSLTQKFQEKLKTPNFFEKLQNLDLKCKNAWKERRWEHLPSVWSLI